MIEVCNLKVAYRGESALCIERLTFCEGKITAVVGLNGSGKSTLLKAVLGLAKKESGTILVDKKPLSRMPHKTRAREIAYLPQSLVQASMDVYTLVCHGRFPYLGYSKILSESDAMIVEEALRLTDLQDKKRKNLCELSGGERQRAYLAMVIAQNTKYLFLDEPTASLDIKHRETIFCVLKKLAESGRGIVTTSHDLVQSFSECDEVCLLSGGRLIACGTAESVMGGGTLKEAMGVGLKKLGDKDLLYGYGLCR